MNNLTFINTFKFFNKVNNPTHSTFRRKNKDDSTLPFPQKHNFTDMTTACCLLLISPLPCWLLQHFFFTLPTNRCYYESKLPWSLETGFNAKKHELLTTWCLSSDARNNISRSKLDTRELQSNS